MSMESPQEYIQVSGKVEILVAFPLAVNVTPNLQTGIGAPAAPTTNAESYLYLRKFGESENGVSIRVEPKYHRVPGDRHGGSEGSPIESQFLGLEASIQLEMSRWDRKVLQMMYLFGGLQTRTITAGTGNGLNGQPVELIAGPGRVSMASVGALMHRDRAMRFLFYSVRDPDLSVNIPCSLFDRPQEKNRGTKYAKCMMGVTGYRAPEGYWGTQVGASFVNTATDFVTGYVWNHDTTGIPSPYVIS